MKETCDNCILLFDCPNELIKQKRLEALKQLGRGCGFKSDDILDRLSLMFPCNEYEHSIKR
jgi:hypothetical protein